MKKKVALHTGRFNLVSILTYIFLFFLPTQLGLHFFPRFSFISGVPIDYLLPTLYMTDILAIILIALHYKSLLQTFKNKFFLGFLVLLGINILFAHSQPMALYKNARILEIICLFLVFKNLQLNLKFVLISFTAGALFEVSLALMQFIYKHSLQGVFYYFGERYMQLSTPGIAKASLNGIEILRPYATFSHPNSMGGFYLLIYIFTLTYPSLKKYFLLKNGLLILTSMIIFLSFSKIVILTYLFLNIFYLLKERTKIGCNFCVFSRLVIFLIVAAIFLTAQGDADSLEKRLTLIDDSLTIFISNPIVGVGMGNYLFAEAEFPIKYPYFFLQPVHNIFLLFLSEAGLLISAYSGFFLYKWSQRLFQNQVLVYVVSAVALTGFFDHYWLTLQQNMILFPVILGLIIHGQNSSQSVNS